MGSSHAWNGHCAQMEKGRSPGRPTFPSPVPIPRAAAKPRRHVYGPHCEKWGGTHLTSYRFCRLKTGQ